MEIKINKWQLGLIVFFIIVIGVIAEGELVNQFTDEEKEAIDKMIEKELRIRNPTNITQEDKDVIRNYYKLSEEIDIRFYSYTKFCDGINNCCYTSTGCHCHYEVVSNYRDNYTIMRDCEGETEISILVSLKKRVYDKEVDKINNKDNAFFWAGEE